MNFTAWCNIQHINPLSPLNMPDYKGPLIHIKDASFGQRPEMRATLDRQLSYGIAEERLLFPVCALRFYLERSMPWREHKRLFVSFKPGHKRDIVSEKRFWSATQIPLHLSLSPTRLRHTRYDPWLHRSHSKDRPP